MPRLLLCALLTCIASTTFAHFPDRKSKPVYPYIDCIGPIGKRMPLSYRRRYNRPPFIGGYLAYLTAPSSQEAMAWHNAVHRGTYQKKCRTEMQYFYPKPWEAMKTGPRTDTDAAELQPVPLQEAADSLRSRYGQDLPSSVIDVLELSEQAQETQEGH